MLKASSYWAMRANASGSCACSLYCEFNCWTAETTSRWRFQSTPAGTPESDALGARMVQNHTGNLLFIGTVLAPAPIYHRNALKNFSVFKTASYEYYRTYPYRPQQWFLDE